MKTFTLSVILLVSTVLGYSQSTVDVIESSQKFVTPDILVIDYEVTILEKNETTAMSSLAVTMDKQIDNLLKLGFSKEKIKLTEFNLDEKIEYFNEKSKSQGYEASQSITIKLLANEKDLVSKLIESMSTNKIENVHLNISTELSEELENKCRLELISIAIKRATQKAELIAKELNTKLLKVKTVEYGDLMYRPLPRMVRFVPPREGIHAQMKMESSPWEMLGASEIEVSEKIHVIWNIE